MIKTCIIVFYSPVSVVRHLGKSLNFGRSIEQTACSSVKVIHLYLLSPIAPILRRKNNKFMLKTDFSLLYKVRMLFVERERGNCVA